MYEVSNYGRIKSLKRRVKHYMGGDKIIGSRIMKVYPNSKHGFLQVSLSKNGRYKTHKVHKLTIEAFMGSCPKGKEVRHLDGDNINNRLCNLAYGTSHENNMDKLRHGTMMQGENHVFSKLSEKDVVEIRKLKIKGVMQKNIAKMFSMSEGQISSIINRVWWKHIK